VCIAGALLLKQMRKRKHELRAEPSCCGGLGFLYAGRRFDVAPFVYTNVLFFSGLFGRRIYRLLLLSGGADISLCILGIKGDINCADLSTVYA
jgi:hypothetical protein